MEYILGVLAGDIVKAAADQNRNFIALGILWGEGYADIEEGASRARDPKTSPQNRGFDVGGKSIQ